jgi:hypothetical protein
MPRPQQYRRIAGNQILDPQEFRAAKTATPLQAHRVEPDLGVRLLPLHVNMRRLVPIRRIEEEPVWPRSQNRRQHIKFTVPTADPSHWPAIARTNRLMSHRHTSSIDFSGTSIRNEELQKSLVCRFRLWHGILQGFHCGAAHHVSRNPVPGRLVGIGENSLICTAHSCVRLKDDVLQTRLQDGNRAILDGPPELVFGKLRSAFMAIVTPGNSHVKFQFVDQRLQWTNVGVAAGRCEDSRLIAAQLEPLRPVITKLLRQKLATPRMFIVVAVDLGMAIEADWNRVRNRVVPRNDVIRLYLHSAEPMADAASSMDFNEQL